jgi:hypothetical protein
LDLRNRVPNQGGRLVPPGSLLLMHQRTMFLKTNRHEKKRNINNDSEENDRKRDNLHEHSSWWHYDCPYIIISFYMF